ncbi:hypothetical protein K456DRAFT_28382 [Colletotrichum gloeosporioides 23]|nr:hypothetical protein K456DRAFT_28382 [Colletotrichum gloeosporioides 23]
MTMDDGEGLFERVVFASLFGGPIETFDLRTFSGGGPAHLRARRGGPSHSAQSVLSREPTASSGAIKDGAHVQRRHEGFRNQQSGHSGREAVRDGAKTGLTKCRGATEKTEEIPLTLGILGRGYHENRAVSVSRHVVPSKEGLSENSRTRSRGNSLEAWTRPRKPSRNVAVFACTGGGSDFPYTLLGTSGSAVMMCGHGRVRFDLKDSKVFYTTGSQPADALRPGATSNFKVLLTPSIKRKMQRDEPS